MNATGQTSLEATFAVRKYLFVYPFVLLKYVFPCDIE